MLTPRIHRDNDDLNRLQLPALGPEQPQQPLQGRNQISPEQYAESILTVGRQIAVLLQGPTEQRIDKPWLRSQMTHAFGGTDAQGAWTWKDAYEAQEVGLIAFLHSAARPLYARMTPSQVLEDLRVRQDRVLTATFRNREQQQFQQFSTPLPLAFLAVRAANVTRADVVLEPSAGTGILATMPRLNGAKVVVNELAANRFAILQKIFDEDCTFNFNAEQINNRLSRGIIPSVVIANPPFSRSPNRKKPTTRVTLDHLNAALKRLTAGGRLVMITGENFKPTSPTWRQAFTQLQQTCTVVGSFGIDGRAYYKNGTTFATRLTVFDKVAAPDATQFANVHEQRLRSHEILSLIGTLPARPLPQEARLIVAVSSPQTPQLALNLDYSPTPHLPRGDEFNLPKPLIPAAPKRSPRAPPPQKDAKPTDTVGKAPPKPNVTVAAEDKKELPTAPPQPDLTPVPVTYRVIEMPVVGSQILGQPQSGFDSFAKYSPQRTEIQGAKPHRTPLVQSVALESVLPPKPQYQPLLPRWIVETGALSDAQLETLIYAGEAHSQMLSGHYAVSEDLDTLTPTSPQSRGARRFRSGLFLGDGTGCGKGRQAAGVILDNFNHGRTKALWLSKSATLIEDAKRDWEDLGGDPNEIVPLNKWKIHTDIALSRGIIFCTYATLVSASGAHSRLSQLRQWLGDEFEGALIFDEAHAMANAVGSESGRGVKKPSQQGIIGLRLQNALPGARILYLSATSGTEPHHFAYAPRLGLWGDAETTSFPDRAEFISAIQEGGVAAMEMVVRDLKKFGRYIGRKLSFDGVETEQVLVELSPEQRHMYDTFAEAFKVIHQNLADALQAAGVVSEDGRTLNGQARGREVGKFENAKQSFFNQVLTAIKVPALIRQIERDLETGHAVVIQLVTTGEAIIKRKLESIPPAERSDLNIDFSPLDRVLDYLYQGFPINLYETKTDENGNEYAEIMTDSDGQDIVSQEALVIRDELIKQMVCLPPIEGAMEQILRHFGADRVAEVTGRSVRILYDSAEGRRYEDKRSAGANTAETASFMAGEKDILMFSKAGGTGRSYHASLNVPNQKRRVHYILEAGWEASEAVQGVGRSHRNHQASAPIVRVISTNVLGEKRFTSTICKRIGNLGAMSQGDRGADQSFFDGSNNLESSYAREALVHFYNALYQGGFEHYSVQDFQQSTGLRLLDKEGNLRVDNLPPINQFLNRLLALPIEEQNVLYADFDQKLAGLIQSAKDSGNYDPGLSQLPGESFKLKNRSVLYTHASSGSVTVCSEIEVKREIQFIQVEAAIAMAKYETGHWADRLILNTKSGNPALLLPHANHTDAKTGATIRTVRRVLPHGGRQIAAWQDHERSHWTPVNEDRWRAAWVQFIEQSEPHKTETIYFISGPLLLVWSSLGQHRKGSDPKVYRVELDNGERLLGRRIPADQIQDIATELGAAATIELTPEDIFQAALAGQRMTLGRGFAIKKVTVQHQARLELIGPVGSWVQYIEAAGCTTEMIQWQMRAFIPNDEHLGPQAIAQLLEAFGSQVATPSFNEDNATQ